MQVASLQQGDCFALLPSVSDHSIHAVITDPPYGTTDLKWDKPIDLGEFWRHVHRVTMPTAVIAMFAAQPFATDLITSNRRNFRYELIWAKRRSVGFLSANCRPLRSHELILVFARRMKGSTYNPQKTSGTPYKNSNRRGVALHYKGKRRIATVNHGDRHPRSVLHCPHDARSVHPTQKPFPLIAWLVASYTRPNDLVLDPFAGSGQVGVACVEQGRGFVGFERDEDYHRIATERIAAAERLDRHIWSL